MVSTHLLKQDLADHRFENLVVRPLGVDTDLFRKNEEILPGTRPVFMFLGRLAVEK